MKTLCLLRILFFRFLLLRLPTLRFFSLSVVYYTACNGFLSAALMEEISTPSMKVYEEKADKLVVYTDVPGHAAPIGNHNPKAQSSIYQIRVRSAATNHEWVKCFVHNTYNRANELPEKKPDPSENVNPLVRQAYQLHTAGWSHAYANVEMSENSIVDVEISKVGPTRLNGSAVIVKSAVHPVHKVKDKKAANGKVYLRITNPCQLVIDINGQMDDHNAAFPDLQQAGPVHALSFFANPIIEKPPISGEGIHYVAAGKLPKYDPSTLPNYTTMVFGPGVHFIGPAFKIYAQKKYYIPGDAILYGSMNNINTPVNGLTNGDSISIYGYGTLNNMYTPHHVYDLKNPSYPPLPPDPIQVGIHIDHYVNINVQGISVMDSANFLSFIRPYHKLPGNDASKVSWIKGITWRQNGDGFGGPYVLEDSFQRTSDDTTVLSNDRRRCTFWKDSNARIIRFKNWKKNTSCTLEDCDIVYYRLRDERGLNGAVFIMNDNDHKEKLKAEQIPVKVLIKNVRFHDRLGNMPIFQLDSKDQRSFSGIVFENISCFLPASPKIRNELKGTKDARWDGAVMFKNVTFNHNNGKAPVLLTRANYKTYFDTNEFVSDSVFQEDPTKAK